ncbi:hypothetical protein D3C83_74410 [compost metagenome]
MRYLLRNLRRQVVEVLVDRVTGMDLVLNAVETGHQHRGEAEIRIAHRVRKAHFDAAPLRVGDQRHTHRGRTVP